MRAHPRERGLGGLLHHVAELAGDRQLARARVGRGLDEEHVAADGRVGEAGRDAGVGGALARVGREAARAEPGAGLVGVDLDLRGLALGDLARGLAQQVGDPPLQVADAGLARVLADHDAQRVVADRHLLLAEAVRLELLRHEVLARDAGLLVLRVAGELDDVHPVEQRAGDRVELVRGADEEHLREVERQVEVVVAEVRVLLGVEHLEHRARRVAAEVGAHLVDLVDQHHRVLRLGVAQGADDRARHRADVGAAVAADLGLVAHAADREPDELAADRAGDRLAERGLADARRADEAEDRAGEVVLQLRDGEVLEDPLLDLLEVVVVLVEDRLRRARGRGCPRWSRSTAAPGSSRRRCGSRRTRPRRAGASRAFRARARRPSWSPRAGSSARPARAARPARPAARRPRRARPGSPSAAGAGSTRAGPSRAPTGPATGSWCRARPPRARA